MYAIRVLFSIVKGILIKITYLGRIFLNFIIYPLTEGILLVIYN